MRAAIDSDPSSVPPQGEKQVTGSSSPARRWAWTLVGLCALASALLVLRATSLYGPGVDGDGVWFVSAAHSLAHGHGLITCRGELYSLWPPLYPAAMAVAERCGVDVFEFVRWSHALAFAGLIVFAARIVERIASSVWPAVATAAVLASALPLYHYWVVVGSEPWFLLFCAGAIDAWGSFAQSRSSRSALAVVAWAGLACAQRYLGVALVTTLALAIVVDRAGGPVLARIRRAAWISAASLSPIAAWCIRNRLLESSWTGGRTPSRFSLQENVGDAMASVASWVWPHHNPEMSVHWVAAPVLAIVAAVGLARAAQAARTSQARALLVAAIAFPVIYTAVLVGLTTVWLVDRIDSRFLLPILPFCVGGVALAVHALGERFLPKQIARAALLALAGVFTVHGASELAARMRKYAEDGAGSFHTRFYVEHPVFQELRRIDVPGVVRSNLPELVWLGRDVPVEMLRSGRKIAARVGEHVRDSGAACTVVWFMENGKPVLFEDEIRQTATVDVLFSNERGVILRVGPR